MPAASSFLRSSSTSRCRFVAFAEFLLNGLELLAQIEFALVLRELSLHLVLNPAAQFDQFQFARQVAVQFVEAHHAVELLRAAAGAPRGRARAACRPRNRQGGRVR